MKILQRTFLLLVMMAMAVSGAFAQKSVTGTVTEEGGGGLPGVNVVIKGSSIGTTTDIEGKYKITLGEGADVLTFSFVGYISQEVTVGAQSMIDVQLAADLTRLEEVVITGLASTVKRTNLANSVASVSAKDLVGTTVPATFDAALYGKFKGANISSNSGAPGGGMSIKLRGTTSITGGSQPLYIVDGVYVDNSSIASGLNAISKAAAGGSASNQDNPSNRIADITMEDIESIEILKGAAAAAIYGSRSSAGVVIITTKKGKAGETTVNVDQTLGASSMLNPLGNREWNDASVTKFFGAGEVAKFNSAKSAGKLYDYEKELYGNKGMLSNTYVSVSGGTDKTTFYTSFVNRNETGIVKNTGYAKQSFRLNLNHDFTDKINLKVNGSFMKSSADRGFFNNDNTGTSMGVAFVSTPSWAELHPDENGNYPNNPYAASNFLQTGALMTNNESVKRFIGGTTLTAKLFQSEKSQLKLIGSAGLDYYTLLTSVIAPKQLQFQKDGNGTNGISVQGTNMVSNINAQAFLVHTYSPTPKIGLTTQGGILALGFDQTSILSNATNLIGSQTNLDQSGAVSIEHTRMPQMDKGFFVQEEFNFDDKIIATVGIRGDKSSNNGDVNKLFYYPKANLAVNIHEFGFWGVDAINQLKVRVAYGQSGKFAPFGSKYTGLGNTIIGGLGGSLVSAGRGNSTISPERQAETEAGFDLGFFKNRLMFDATYYRKNVTDLLLNAQVPTSSGFSSKLSNAADLVNQGVELGLTAAIVQSKDFQWNSTLNFWLNRSKVTRLDVPAFNTGGFGTTLGTFRIEKDKSVTQIVGRDPNQKDGSGISVMGNSEPDFQTSWSNLLTYKNVDLSFMFHWRKGSDNVNLTTLLTDLSGTSADYDAVTVDPDGKMANGDYRVSQLGVSARPFIEDASYLRLREVGMFYRISKQQLSGVLKGTFKSAKLGISGNNLINIFKYNSYDPEVSNFGGGGLSSGVEVTPFPSSKRAMFHVSFQF